MRTNVSTEVPTCGAILADGVVIDVVGDAIDEPLSIILGEENRAEIARQIEHNGTIYVAPNLRAGIRQAIRFPAGVREYGGTPALFRNVANVLRRELGLSMQNAAAATAGVFSTWIPERFGAPLTIRLIGNSTAQVKNSFRLLSALCRRSIIVSEFSHKIPAGLCPTLLLTETEMLANVKASADRGCCKVVFSELGDATGASGDELLIVRLSGRKLRALTDRAQAGLAAEYQSQFELYRLRYVQRTSLSQLEPFPPETAGPELRREVSAYVEGGDFPRILVPPGEYERVSMQRRC